MIDPSQAEPPLIEATIAGHLSLEQVAPVEAFELIPPEHGEVALTGAVNTLRPKRLKWERENDLLRVSEMLTEGKSSVEIARELNEIPGRRYSLSQRQIRYDVALLVTRVEEEVRAVPLITLKARELAKLDRLERLALKQYARSQDESQTASQTTVGAAMAGEPGGQSRVATISKTIAKARRDGDVNMLRLCLQIQDMRARILNIYDPLDEKEINDTHQSERAKAIQQVAKEEMEVAIREEIEEEVREDERAKREAATVDAEEVVA